MDNFVTKSSSTCNSTGSKSKTNNYGKDCEITMKKKKWQMKWLEEFSWMPIHTEPGVMKCKLCCKWPNMVLLSFFLNLVWQLGFAKVQSPLFDHCELIGISSSFCQASNCTCQLPRDKFCQTYSSDPDGKFFSQFSKLFFCYRTLFGAVTSSF